MITRDIAATGLFLLFLFSGGLWLSLAQFLPDGLPRAIVVVVLGALFVAVFLWLLIVRVRAILGGTQHFKRDMALIGLDLALLVMAFAWVYQIVGIIDNTMPDHPIVHHLPTALYYSIVTFTTLGYGDFYPVGPGRALAALEALTGYLILGILVSTLANVLSPHHQAGFADPDELEE